eukprot:5482129-Amphidinium_carterae.1
MQDESIVDAAHEEITALEPHGATPSAGSAPHVCALPTAQPLTVKNLWSKASTTANPQIVQSGA